MRFSVDFPPKWSFLLKKYVFFQYFELHVLLMGLDCTKIAWGRSGSKIWQKICIFMLDFDAEDPISKEFPMESIILPHPLGVHLRRGIGAPGLPNRRNFARGIRFRGLEPPKRPGNATFPNFPPAAGYYTETFPPAAGYCGPTFRKQMTFISLSFFC